MKDTNQKRRRRPRAYVGIVTAEKPKDKQLVFSTTDGKSQLFKNKFIKD